MKKRLKDIDLYSVYGKWRKNTGPFCCYVRASNFVSLKHYPDFELKPTAEGIDIAPIYPKLQAIMEQHDSGQTLFFMDLPGEAAIKAAYKLAEDYQLKPVLALNNLLHPKGLVGGEDYISALLTCGEALTDFRPEGFVFVQDSNRYGTYTDEELRKFFNNQYDMTDEDVPPVQMLRDLGYECVVYICQETEKEDVAEYLNYLEQEDFCVIREYIGNEL